MAKYPQTDLLAIPGDLDLRLQSDSILDRLHTVSEDNSFFYTIAHVAVNLTTGVSINVPEHVRAADTGAKIFEAIGYSVTPEATYQGQCEKIIIAGGAQQFLEAIRSTEDYLTMFDYAAVHMRRDAPILTELITEVAGRYTDHDKVATQFAVKTAAAIRSMQIYVDKRIEAVS